MLEHGLSVSKYTFDLVRFLRSEGKIPFEYNWRLPSWFFAYGAFLSRNLCSDFTIDKYLKLHDCGKHKVQISNEKGGFSYPNHAQSSHETFLTFCDDLEIAELIKRDMDIHLLKTEDVPAFCEEVDKTIICTLLLSAVGSLHSNAEMFGGIDSDSFKIKFKQIEKKGKMICNLLFV